MPKNEYCCDCNIVHHELVHKAMENMPNEYIINKVSEFYKIVGDGTRLKLICALFDSEMCVCDLANVLSMSKSSISHQLSKMKECGVVKARRDGKEVYYSLDDEHVIEILQTTITHIQHKKEENV